MLRCHQCHAGIHECLLRVQDVERRALPDPRLLAHTVQRNFALDGSIAVASRPKARHPASLGAGTDFQRVLS